jgi:uncharacterized membrane protein
MLAALHAAIACGLAFRFLRAQGRSRYASFVCGAASGLSAHTGRMSGSLPELAALAWAPLVLELLLRVVRGERQRHGQRRARCGNEDGMTHGSRE